MYFFYLANVRLPTEKAHGVQIVNTCKELAKLCTEKGVHFELIVAKRTNSIKKEVWEYYDIPEEDRFKITKIKVMDFHKPYKLFYWLQKIEFFVKTFFYLARHFGRKELQRSIIYSRDEFLILWARLLTCKIFWESHEGKYHFLVKILFRFLQGLIVISLGLKNFYKDKFTGEILVAEDAVDLEKFKIFKDKNLIKKELGLSSEKKYVTYIGSLGLYSWKGADVFLDASQHNFDQSIQFLVVGGGKEEIEVLKNKYKDVYFVGQKPHPEIPLWQKASDILVIPNKSGNIVSEQHTSPMKLFEYMASGVPIVASDLPSLRSVLTDKSAHFFTPNDSASLWQTIQQVIGNYELSVKKGEFAQEDAKNYTYEARTKKIFNYII